MKACTWLAVVLAAASIGCSSNKGGSKPPSGGDLTDRIKAVRVEQIKRQAPQVGVPVDLALAMNSVQVKLCPQTGSSGDGSFTCDGGCSEVGTDCVHAWCLTGQGSRNVRYMFAEPTVLDGCIAHEIHHELIIRFYGIGGHPAKSTVTRIDNGKPLTITHQGVIGWRWPALVNWALPASAEIASTNWDGVKCGTK